MLLCTGSDPAGCCTILCALLLQLRHLCCPAHLLILQNAVPYSGCIACVHWVCNSLTCSNSSCDMLRLEHVTHASQFFKSSLSFSSHANLFTLQLLQLLPAISCCLALLWEPVLPLRLPLSPSLLALLVPSLNSIHHLK